MDPSLGYEIVIDGNLRTFRDTWDSAYEAARYLKQKNRTAIVEIVTRANGARQIVIEDGRIA